MRFGQSAASRGETRTEIDAMSRARVERRNIVISSVTAQASGGELAGARSMSDQTRTKLVQNSAAGRVAQSSAGDLLEASRFREQTADRAVERSQTIEQVALRHRGQGGRKRCGVAPMQGRKFRANHALQFRRRLGEQAAEEAHVDRCVARVILCAHAVWRHIGGQNRFQRKRRTGRLQFELVQRFQPGPVQALYAVREHGFRTTAASSRNDRPPGRR